MKLLSDKSIQQVSGGSFSKAEYDAHTYIWSLIGLGTAAASLSLIPLPYGEYFAIRIAAVGVGSIAGYVFGAIEYYATNSITSSIDYYLSP